MTGTLTLARLDAIEAGERSWGGNLVLLGGGVAYRFGDGGWLPSRTRVLYRGSQRWAHGPANVLGVCACPACEPDVDAPARYVLHTPHTVLTCVRATSFSAPTPPGR